MLREMQKDIKSIESLSGKYVYTLAKGQVFYKTAKAYEIWNENPLFRVKSLNRKNIGWVNTY